MKSHKIEFALPEFALKPLLAALQTRVPGEELDHAQRAAMDAVCHEIINKFSHGSTAEAKFSWSPMTVTLVMPHLNHSNETFTGAVIGLIRETINKAKGAE